MNWDRLQILQEAKKEIDKSLRLSEGYLDIKERELSNLLADGGPSEDKEYLQERIADIKSYKDRMRELLQEIKLWQEEYM